MGKGTLFVLSAPSGAGKSTILQSVMANLPGLVFSISHTTRDPRKGETNGVEYHFVDRHTFMKLCDEGKFLEYAEVHGNFYGTTKMAVQEQLDKGFDVILDIDVQGAGIIRDSCKLEPVFIFLSPPSRKELERRLRGRGLDSDETISTRLKNAETEMQSMHLFDYVIINDQLDIAIKMFESVILAERARDGRGFDGLSIGTSYSS